MPRPPKIHLHGTVLFATARVEQGVLLLSNPLMNVLWRSALARAQELHPVRISAFVIEQTHVHFLMVVENPNDVKGFMERFKTESAHAINRMLGRKKRTIWCEGYDSPVVLTKKKVVDTLVYIYTNPAKDCQESSISRYPGVSTWEMFIKKRHRANWAWIHRPNVPCLKGKFLSAGSAAVLGRQLVKRAKESCQFHLEPNAWMEFFGIESAEEQEHENKEIIRRVQEQEEHFAKLRKQRGIKVIGRQRLVQEQLNTERLPDNSGRRMWCICDDIELRITFINYIKALRNRAREVYERWKLGDFSEPFPLGLYPPSMPKLAELIAVW